MNIPDEVMDAIVIRALPLVDSSNTLPECPTCGKRTYSFLHSCPYRGLPHHWWLTGPASTEGES